MQQISSTDQAVYQEEFDWIQVISFTGTPKIKLDRTTFDVLGYQHWSKRDPNKHFKRLEFIAGGNVIVIVGTVEDLALVQALTTVAGAGTAGVPSGGVLSVNAYDAAGVLIGGLVTVGPTNLVNNGNAVQIALNGRVAVQALFGASAGTASLSANTYAFEYSTDGGASWNGCSAYVEPTGIGSPFIPPTLVQQTPAGADGFLYVFVPPISATHLRVRQNSATDAIAMAVKLVATARQWPITQEVQRVALMGKDGSGTARDIATDANGALGVIMGGKPIGGIGAAVAGNLTNINDTVVLPVAGNQWATAKFTVNGGAGTATVTAQISLDGGNNWLAAPYAKRLNLVAGNPTVQAFSASALSANDTWEVPLPSNATHFRLLCAASGTGTAVTLAGSALLTPGAPVHAVLYDVLSAVNTLNDTGTLDVSGWASLALFIITPAGGSASVFTVQDQGGDAAQLGTIPASANVWFTWGLGAAGANAIAQQLARRIHVTSPAVAALTSRIRIEARR